MEGGGGRGGEASVPKNSTSAIVRWLAAKSVTAGPALILYDWMKKSKSFNKTQKVTAGYESEKQSQYTQ